MSTLLATLALLGSSTASAHVPLRGVGLHSLWFDSSSADVNRELDLSKQAGSTVVRVDVVWGSLETDGKGQINAAYLDKLDRFVAGASARGMTVLATLWSSPCWASAAPETLKLGCRGDWWNRQVGNYPSRDPQDYADIAKWIVNRYGTKLAALEVWNEPNLGSSWQALDKTGDYVDMLRATYRAVKSIRTDVPVLAGALSFSDRDFLEGLYAKGMRGFEDGVSVHPYNEWRAPDDLWRPQFAKYAFLPGLASMRDAQLAAGDGAGGLWLTEFGWTTANGERWGVTEAQQADFVGKAFDLIEGLDYVKAAAVYNLRDKDTDPASFEGNFGLVNRDFTPKPAFAALTAALHRNVTAASRAPSGGGGSAGSSGSSRSAAIKPAADPAFPSEPSLASLPSDPGDVVPVKVVQRAGQVVAVARVASGRTVLLDALRCTAAPRLRMRATASRNGNLAKRIGRSARPRCKVLGRVVSRRR